MQLKSMNVKISKISSLIHYHFSVKELAGTKTYFLRRFIIMRNAYIFSLFGSQSKYLAQFFNVIIRILSSLLKWKNSRRHFIYHSRVLKPDKLEGAFQMENLAIFLYYWMNIVWTQEIFINIEHLKKMCGINI